MYDNNSFSFDYDCQAILYEIRSNSPVKKKLKTIDVREFSEWQQDASFATGIANLGVIYAVATNEKIDINKIKPYMCQLVIDNIEYKIVIIKQHFTSVGVINNFKEKEKETIFFLG